MEAKIIFLEDAGDHSIFKRRRFKFPNFTVYPDKHIKGGKDTYEVTNIFLDPVGGAIEIRIIIKKR